MREVSNAEAVPHPVPLLDRSSGRSPVLLAAGVAAAASAWWWLAFETGAMIDEGMSDAAPELPVPAVALAFVIVLGRAVLTLIEAGFYTLWWSAVGAKLPVGRFVVALGVLSILDVTSEALRMWANDDSSVAPWLALLAGPGVWPDGTTGWPAGLRAAVAGAGLLTLARITGTAWVQAELLRTRFLESLALTALVWCFGRSVVFFAADLLRGMSPVG